MTAKETFYDDLKAFFDSGLMKELYMTDKLCICELGQFTYIVFTFIKDAESGKQIGFTASHPVIKKIEKNDFEQKKIPR